MMKSLSIHIRNGFILAKAVRIASISQPENLESFGLVEAINVDDVITSFILKAHLFDDVGYKSEFDKSKTSHDVALMIYEHLRTSLKEKLIVSNYAGECPVDCTRCDGEYGCCKQRKLMLAMVEKILEWLKEYKDELQDIDYADDVHLAQCYTRKNEESDDSKCSG